MHLERWRLPWGLAICALCGAMLMAGPAPVDVPHVPSPLPVARTVDELSLEELLEALAIRCPERSTYDRCACRCGNDEEPCADLPPDLRRAAERELRERLRQRRGLQPAVQRVTHGT